MFLGTLPDMEVVGHAHSGCEALAEAERLRPDLVLLDIAMPEMSGFEVAQALQSRPQSPRIVFLSLHDTSAYRATAQAHGAAGFVSKADFGVELIPLLKELAGGTGLDSESAL